MMPRTELPRVALLVAMLAMSGTGACGDDSPAGGDAAPTPDAGTTPDAEPTADADPTPDANPDELTAEQFAEATRIYFQRCAGCHGTLRMGATGPNLTPERLLGEGYNKTILVSFIAGGTSAGMPAFEGVLTAYEIDITARFLLLPPPDPPPWTFTDIQGTWNEIVKVADRVTAPSSSAYLNYIGVILRDAGQVAIVDGTTYELVKLVDTGYAVHILRTSSDGRYFYSVGRDGRITMIDLWPAEPTTVATVQGCLDARSVDASKFTGYEGKFAIEGCYWPPQYVVMDGQTLEPLKVVPLPMTDIYGAALTENRVAAIVASHSDPVWVANFKESGHVAIIDYSDVNFPIKKLIKTAKFLHDGGWDATGQYFMTAANMSDLMVIVDVTNQRLEDLIPVGVKPHPGRGANWVDGVFGPVNATPHLGSPVLAVYGTDPVTPQYQGNAWRVVRNIEIPQGSLFLKTHPNSKHVWVDATTAQNQTDARSVCVIRKSTAAKKCFQVADHGRVTHFEFNQDGTEVWVSVWDSVGELIVFSDADNMDAATDAEWIAGWTPTELKRIDGADPATSWVKTPTGKFNVYNTARDIY